MDTLNAMLNDFHFLRPLWLLAIIPLLVLVGLLKYSHGQRSGWQQVLSGHLYQHMVQTRANGQRRPPFFWLGLAWILASVAMAGPTWERLPQPVYQLHSGKVVVMDLSLSMRATDISPDRLTRARYKAMDLVNAMQEGEMGLVAYAGDAFTIAPLSNDGQTLNALIPALRPEIMPVPGSAPITGLEQAAELLKSAGYKDGDIIWVTDGIDMSQSQSLNDWISDQPYRLSILAVGTAEGAPITLNSGELLKDNQGSIVIPKLRASLLKPLAERTGGRYAPLQADDSDVEYLLSQDLLNRDTTEQDERDDPFGDQWREAGPWLVLLLLPIAAYAFRRGVLLSLPLMLSASLLVSPAAEANWWDNLWQRPDQQGQARFEQEDYAGAAERFDDPMWQGSAHYKNGDYEQALTSFQKNDSADALYNQGNALAKMGRIDDAIEAYERALEKNPQLADAAANKTKLEEFKEQQQQQQKNQDGDEGSDGEQGEQNQQGDNSDNPSQGEGEQQQNEPNDSQSQNSSAPKEGDSNDAQQDAEPSQQDENNRDGEPQDAETDKNEPQHQQAQGDEQTDAQTAAANAEMTDEEREQQQRLQKLMRRVPDDPAYLLQRKMQLEYQQRRRQSLPNPEQENW